MHQDSKKHSPLTEAEILLVDDHPLVREGIRQCLQQVPGFHVCGEAANATEAMRALDAQKPDLLIVDIALPGRDGLELIKDILALHPETLILVLSMFDEELYAERVLRAGARGYIMKHEPPERLIKAVHAILEGKLVASEAIIQRVLNRITTAKSTQAILPMTLLSDRELEIFRLIGQGFPRHYIANQLNISVKTFEAHRSNIRQKLNLRSAAEVLLHASQFIREESSRSSLPPAAPAT